MEGIMKSLIQNLTHLMHQQKISEAELARKTNIPQPTLHKILSGKTADPRISTLQLLADYFEVTLDELAHVQVIKTKHIQAKIQFIPLLTWADCARGESFREKLLTDNWEQCLVVEYLAEGAFGLMSKPSMEPRFPRATLLIIDPHLTAEDGDLVVVHYPDTEEATLRELSIDGPSKQLLSINHLSQEEFSPEIKILGVVVQSRFSYSK
jgi:transcriptional regulator with XRE-family HTH domain